MAIASSSSSSSSSRERERVVGWWIILRPRTVVYWLSSAVVGAKFGAEQ